MEDLISFLNNPVNSVTRERLFYNRLYYDLKLAAAHSGYPLTLYEPEVDRDGFDVVLDDGDATRFVQLKTVLASSTTTTWDISKRFLRPEPVLAEAYGIVPADAGKGGAVVLIEIDATLSDPTLTYRVTDFSILLILSTVLGRTTARPPGAAILGSRRTVAEGSWLELQRGSPKHKVKLNKSSFLKAKGPAGLLSLLGLHSENQCYQPATRMMLAQQGGFRVERDGTINTPPDLTPLAFGRSCAEDLLHAVDEPALAIHPTLLPVGQGGGVPLP
ncbi:MAG: hypothetical protein QOK17_2431 [Sphingomonadales bacterium]|jgi:hypothetical protein|nr:hypothetical protein [Sphingomonadales bacterium]